jgi:hypothetical protein
MDHRNGADGKMVREEIHLPGNSLLPLFAALGITLSLIGLILTMWFTIAGLIITAVTIVRWVSIVGQDIERLPTERPE